MDFTQLDNSYKYETIASALYGRELEYFHYEFDLTNFKFMAEQSTGEALADLNKRIGEIQAQMLNVILCIKALESQIDDQEAYDKAVVTVTARRLEEKNNETCPRSK